MKKFLTLALAVLAVAAAQAVTINWTLSLGGPDNNKPGWAGLLMTTEKITDQASLKALITTSKNEDNDTYTVKDNTKATAINVSSGAPYAQLGEDSGSVELSFVTEVATDSVTFALFNIWNLNGGNSNNPSSAGFATLTVSGIDTTADSLTIDLSDTLLEWAKNDVKTTSVTVPEPTALALLALGVAGLALKRKHA